MKIDTVELHPDGSSNVCTLSFRDVSRENPYNVKGITGLDADEITKMFYGTPGSQEFYNLMGKKKEIVALIELNPRWELGESPSSLRDDLYKMIASSRRGIIDIQFKLGDAITASIQGSVAKFEASLFTPTPEVQMTIQCKKSFLEAPEPVSLDVIGLDPVLTVINDPLSTAPHGLKFELKVTAATASFSFTDPDDPTWFYTITPYGGFLVNDVIHFSSEWNDKYIYVVRGGTTIYLADTVQHGSVWPIMFPGETKLAISNGVNLDWNAISYVPTYWGVEWIFSSSETQHTQ